MERLRGAAPRLGRVPWLQVRGSLPWLAACLRRFVPVRGPARQQLKFLSPENPVAGQLRTGSSRKKQRKKGKVEWSTLRIESNIFVRIPDELRFEYYLKVKMLLRVYMIYFMYIDYMHIYLYNILYNNIMEYV